MKKLTQKVDAVAKFGDGDVRSASWDRGHMNVSIRQRVLCEDTWYRSTHGASATYVAAVHKAGARNHSILEDGLKETERKEKMKLENHQLCKLPDYVPNRLYKGMARMRLNEILNLVAKAPCGESQDFFAPLFARSLKRQASYAFS